MEGQGHAETWVEDTLGTKAASLSRIWRGVSNEEQLVFVSLREMPFDHRDIGQGPGFDNAYPEIIYDDISGNRSRVPAAVLVLFKS